MIFSQRFVMFVWEGMDGWMDDHFVFCEGRLGNLKSLSLPGLCRVYYSVGRRSTVIHSKFVRV